MTILKITIIDLTTMSIVLTTSMPYTLSIFALSIIQLKKKWKQEKCGL